MFQFDHARRTFCRVAGICGLGALCGAVGCTSGGGDSASGEGAATGTNAAASAAAADPCADLSGLTANEIALRDTFGYVPRSDDPEVHCSVCEFWEAPTAGAACGGCQLFAGPVEPEGSCNSFSPI
jgi:hypothetical protein